MKVKVNNYSFNKTAKTVTFTDYASIRLDSILLITNATDSTIIFNFADPTKGGTVTGNVLTLAFDTAAMENTDKLLIYYDDTADEVALSSKQDDIVDEISNKDIMIALKSLIFQIANPGWYDKTANQLRVQSTGTSTVTFASNQDVRNITGAVAAVTNQVSMDGYQGKLMVLGINNTSWQLTVRNKIS
jgi:hypothetical protein